MATITYYNGLKGDPVPAWLTPTIKNAIDTLQTRELNNITTEEQRTGHFIKFYSNGANISVYYIFFDRNTTAYLPTDASINNYVTINPSALFGYQWTWYFRGSASPAGFARPWASWQNVSIQTTTTEIYVEDANIPFDMGGEPFDPTKHDERFFTKDPTAYILNVGVAADETSEYDNYYYATKAYNINLRWKSLRTGTEYTYPLTNLITQRPLTLQPPLSGTLYTFNYSTEHSSIASALRMPIGVYASAADIPTEYSDLTDLRSFNQITLQTLIDYMQTQTAGATEQDIFTEIFADFIVDNDVVETLSCDYTSLFGDETIDVNSGTVNDPNAADSIADTNIYTDSVALTVPSLTATGVFNRCYTLDGNSVNDLCDFLYNANDATFDEIIDGVLTRGNPIDSIIDLRLYPFDVRQFTGGGTAQAIKFGRTQTTVIGSLLPHNANAVISLGSCVVPRVYNNFLDYQMDVTLYIPFCGVVSLPVDRVLNHTVSIKLIVDYVTGACVAVVYVDNIPLLYQSGVIGVSIPMTATNSADFAKTIVGNLITGASQIATKNVGQAASTALDTVSALHDGSKIQTAGASSPQTALFQPKNAYLLLSIVNPPDGVYNSEYAELVGYACFMPVTTINTMTGNGFVAFDNVKLDIPQATEQEKTDIQNLLRAGVFI